MKTRFNGVANFEQKGDWSTMCDVAVRCSLEKNRLKVSISNWPVSANRKELRCTCRKTTKHIAIVEQPRETFQQILSVFFEKKWTPLVEKTATIHAFCDDSNVLLHRALCCD
jgi:hypothetical protein